MDSYFTKEPLGTKNFYPGSVGIGNGQLITEYGIDLEENNIPEVNDIKEKYGTVLTTFSLNDYEHHLHIASGIAGKKYGEIFLEDYLHMFDSLDEWNGFNLQGIFGCVEASIETYIHEFTHTVEMQIKYEDLPGGYGLHQLIEVLPANTIFPYVGDFLRMEYCIDGKYIGIPYEFWTGEYFNEK